MCITLSEVYLILSFENVIPRNNHVPSKMFSSISICLQQYDITSIKLPGDMLGFSPKLKLRLRQSSEASKIMDFYILCAPACLNNSTGYMRQYI